MRLLHRGDVGQDPRVVQVAYGDDRVVVTLAEGASLSDVVSALMLEAPDVALDGPAVLVFRHANLGPIDLDRP